MCIGVTIFVAHTLKFHMEMSQQAKRTAQGNEFIHLIQDRLNDYEVVLNGARAMASLDGKLDRARWRAYAEGLDMHGQYPGVLGISLVPLVTPQNRSEVVQRLRSEWGNEFRIWPEPQGVSAPVAYMEPLSEENLEVIGFDLFSEQVRREALERATDTRTPCITGRLQLVQDAGKPAKGAFLMCLPIYAPGARLDTVQQRRSALVGFLTSAFRIEDFMRSLESRIPEGVGFELYDGGRADAERLYFASANHEDDHVGGKGGESLRTFEVFGQSWTLRLLWLPHPDDEFSRHSPLMVLGGGLAISLLLALFLVTLCRTREKAQALAEEMTTALRESEERYRAFFSSGESVRLITDSTDGRIVDANDAAIAFYGYGPGLKGLYIYDINILPKEQVMAELDRAARNIKNHFQFRHRLASGELRDVDVHISTIQVEGRLLVASSIHDVTEFRRLERLREDVEQIMRHDLKAPLSAFVTLPKLMSEDERLGPDQRDSLLVMHHTAMRMLQQINAMLALQKIESGDYAPVLGECRPVQAVDQTARMLEKSKGMSLNRLSIVPGEEDFAVQTDPVLFDAAVMNILNNALEAGELGDPVRVEIRREDGGCAISVWNKAPVPVEMRTRFFEKYATAGKVGGTGLGTYSAWLMARAMGGTIEMETSDEGGTTVTLRVPDRALPES